MVILYLLKRLQKTITKICEKHLKYEWTWLLFELSIGKP